MVDYINIQNSSVLAGVDEGYGAVVVPNNIVLVGYSLKESDYTRVTNDAILLGTTYDTTPRVTNTALLVAYRDDERQNYELRAFVFKLDGHGIYGVHLGVQGTWVYDTLTNEWSKFITEGYSVFNFEIGLTYDDRIIGGDNQGPELWLLDAESQLDQGFKPIRRVVTGVVSVRSRDAVSVWGLDVDATVDSYSYAEATMELSISDNGGVTYVDIATKELTTDDNGYPISFRSLGTIRAPGRVFRIEDFGGPVTIRGASLRLDT